MLGRPFPLFLKLEVRFCEGRMAGKYPVLRLRYCDEHLSKDGNPFYKLQEKYQDIRAKCD
jgi:hypothetical protein